MSAITPRQVYCFVGPRSELQPKRRSCAGAGGAERRLLKEQETNTDDAITRQVWSQSDPSRKPIVRGSSET